MLTNYIKMLMIRGADAQSIQQPITAYTLPGIVHIYIRDSFLRSAIFTKNRKINKHANLLTASLLQGQTIPYQVYEIYHQSD